MILRNIVLAIFSLVLATGCRTTITNLTPSQLPRNANNLYPFEVALETSQKSIREESIKPFVMVGTELYPMQPTPLLKNRWEAVVPVPSGTNIVHYRYKFDYHFDRIPEPGSGSRLSPPYVLEITPRRQ